MEEKKELVIVETGLAQEIVSVSDQYCSFKPANHQQKATLFKIMNNPEKRLADCINMDIELKDLYMEKVMLLDKNTGEIKPAPRIVLIDKDGVGYQCVSVGIFGALKKMISIFGEPTWKEPIKVKIRQTKTQTGNSILTMDII